MAKIKKVMEITNYTLSTLSTEYTQQASTDSSKSFTVCVRLTCEHICMMMIMRNNMPKTGCDLKLSLPMDEANALQSALYCAVSPGVKSNVPGAHLNKLMNKLTTDTQSQKTTSKKTHLLVSIVSMPAATVARIRTQASQ